MKKYAATVRIDWPPIRVIPYFPWPYCNLNVAGITGLPKDPIYSQESRVYRNKQPSPNPSCQLAARVISKTHAMLHH
jgi:hypothetical protein